MPKPQIVRMSPTVSAKSCWDSRPMSKPQPRTTPPSTLHRAINTVGSENRFISLYQRYVPSAPMISPLVRGGWSVADAAGIGPCGRDPSCMISAPHLTQKRAVPSMSAPQSPQNGFIASNLSASSSAHAFPQFLSSWRVLPQATERTDHLVTGQHIVEIRQDARRLIAETGGGSIPHTRRAWISPALRLHSSIEPSPCT